MNKYKGPKIMHNKKIVSILLYSNEKFMVGKIPFPGIMIIKEIFEYECYGQKGVLIVIDDESKDSFFINHRDISITTLVDR